MYIKTFKNGDSLSKFDEWFAYRDNSVLILVQMQLFDYETIKEKVTKFYTVEIPDPNSLYKHRYLSRCAEGIVIDASNDTQWKQKKRNQLAESEIKKDFGYLWQFAEEVE